MAKQEKLFLTKAASNTYTQFQNADTTTAKAIYTAAADDAKITGIYIQNSSASAYDVTIYSKVSGGATLFPIGVINIPASSGATNAVSNVNIMLNSNFSFLPIDPNLNKYWNVKGLNEIHMKVNTTLTAGHILTVGVIAEDY